MIQLKLFQKIQQSNPNQTLKICNWIKANGSKNCNWSSILWKSNLSRWIKELTFLSLTNKTIDLPKNVINAGINATSQLNAIKKFIELNEIKKTIFLTPDVRLWIEIKKGIKNSKIKILENYIYNTDPTKLTKQIEKITNYKIRKQNLEDEINRLEKSEQKIKKD